MKPLSLGLALTYLVLNAIQYASSPKNLRTAVAKAEEFLGTDIDPDAVDELVGYIAVGATALTAKFPPPPVGPSSPAYDAPAAPQAAQSTSNTAGGPSPVPTSSGPGTSGEIGQQQGQQSSGPSVDTYGVAKDNSGSQGHPDGEIQPRGSSLLGGGGLTGSASAGTST